MEISAALWANVVCVCAILPEKAVRGMTHTVSGWMLNSTHSLTYSLTFWTKPSL